MIRKFITYFRPHRKLFILDMVCAFLVASLDLTGGIYSKLYNAQFKGYIPDDVI